MRSTTSSAVSGPAIDLLNDGREPGKLRLDGFEVRLESRGIVAVAEAPAEQLDPSLQDGEG
jgi:hypothetical protein